MAMSSFGTYEPSDAILAAMKARVGVRTLASGGVERVVSAPTFRLNGGLRESVPPEHKNVQASFPVVETGGIAFAVKEAGHPGKSTYEAGLVCCSAEDDENEDGGFFAALSWLWEEDNCCPKLHRSCLSKYLIIQAESGHFPPTCPFCLRKLSLVEVYKSLTAAEAAVWLRQHDRWRELRESGRADADLEEITALQDLGCRRCPSCGTWIQKQSGGWVTGCDKMTCRCGARFCFQCGSVEASCSCSLGHDFLEKELVLANYSLLDLPWPLSLLFEDEPESDEPSASHVGLQRPETQNEELNAEVAEPAADSCEDQDLGPASSSTAAPQGQQCKDGTGVAVFRI
eukprot:s60_g48.t1